MADRLKAAGYRTALFGKWHLGSAERFHPMRRGFDEFFGFLGGEHSYLDVAHIDVAQICRTRCSMAGSSLSVTYLTDALGDRAAISISGTRQVPSSSTSHSTPRIRRWKRRRSILRASRHRRRTAPYLRRDVVGNGRRDRQDDCRPTRAANLEENTLIFFFSDNGGPTMEKARRSMARATHRYGDPNGRRGKAASACRSKSSNGRDELLKREDRTADRSSSSTCSRQYMMAAGVPPQARLATRWRQSPAVSHGHGHPERTT